MKTFTEFFNSGPDFRFRLAQLTRDGFAITYIWTDPENATYVITFHGNETI